MKGAFFVVLLSLVVIGCSADDAVTPSDTTRFVEFRLVSDAIDGDSQRMTLVKTGEQLHLGSEVLLDLSDVERAELVSNDEGKSYLVYLILTDEGKRKFREITGANLGRRLGVVVDGRLVQAPTILEQINSGKIPVFFQLDKSEAEEESGRINAVLADLG